MLPNHLRELREDRGLTQTQLGELVHASQAQIDRLEKGQRKLTPEWVQRLAKALECGPHELKAEHSSLRPDQVELLSVNEGLSESQRAAYLHLGHEMAKQPPKRSPEREALDAVLDRLSPGDQENLIRLGTALAQSGGNGDRQSGNGD